MASSLDILIKARDEASRTINNVRESGQRLDSTLTNAGKSTSRLGGFFKSTAGKLVAVAGGAFAVKQAFDFGADLIHSAEEAQAATRRSFALIRSDADATGINLGGLTDWAESFGNRIGQDDEAITTLAAKITQGFDLGKLFGKGNEGDALTMLTESVVDFSAATGKSQSLAVRLFQTIANTPTTAIGQLQKLGVITQAQADHYKKLADNGHAAEVSQELLGLVSQKYAGAAAKGTTASQRLSAVWDNLKETLGGFLLPAFQKLVGWLASGAKWFQTFVQGGNGASEFFGSIGDKVRTVIGALSDFWQSLAPVREAVGQVASIVADGLGQAFDALVGLWKSSLQPALSDLWDALKALWDPVLKAVAIAIGAVVAVALILASKALPFVIKAVGLVIKITAALVKGIALVVQWFGNLVASAIRSFAGIVKAFSPVVGFFSGVWNAVKTVAVTVWDAIIGRVRDAWGTISGVWQKARAWFTTVWHGIRDVGVGIWDAVKGAAVSVFNGIASAWNHTVGALSFHVPSWVPGIGGKGFDVPDIPYLAQGGIVTRPTVAMIGEAGPEAVIPLNRLPAERRGPMLVRLDRRRFSEELSYDATYRGW